MVCCFYPEELLVGCWVERPICSTNLCNRKFNIFIHFSAFSYWKKKKALKETYIYEGGPFCGKLNLVRVNIISRLDHETGRLHVHTFDTQLGCSRIKKFMFQVLYIFIVCHTHTVLNLIQCKWRYLRSSNICFYDFPHRRMGTFPGQIRIPAKEIFEYFLYL